MKRIDRPEVYVVFCLVIFLFNQSKNYAILEPKKKRIRVLAGFEAKAKEGRPRCQGHPGGLDLGRPKCDMITCKLKILKN